MKYKTYITNYLIELGFKNILYDMSSYYDKINKEDSTLELGLCLVNDIKSIDKKLFFNVYFRNNELITDYSLKNDVTIMITEIGDEKIDCVLSLTLENKDD